MSLSQALSSIRETLGNTIIIEDNQKYIKDKTVQLEGSVLAAFAPANTEEVAALMKILHRYRIPVIARGGGTGVTGAAIPFEAAVISFERMNRILEIDTANMTALVEPGVITKTLQDEAMRHNLFYPPDPASLENCTIGGNVSVSAGGPHAVKYGTTKDFILGLEFVTADGTIMNWGGKFVKNSAGYSLGPLVIGSEGTLAVITRLTVKLLPYPSARTDVLASFRSIDEAVDCVKTILLSPVNPAALEFIDGSAISIVERHSDGTLPFPGSGALLLLRLDGFDQESLEREYLQLAEILNENASGFSRADDEASRTELWRCRRSIRNSIEAESPVFFAEDPAVPRSEIPSFIRNVKKRISDFGARAVFFGHAGDGNIHINILKYDLADERWEEMKPQIKSAIYDEAIAHGGTITGEHGIGFLRKSFMKRAYSEEELALMKRIKQAFDPFNLLNPGKIFD